ncbi:hypothetical protein HU200_017973 [Digitaria exilis]|uniref:PH domain-containing protein n=1 Tax=Digitaria exilis TaxID=1010633 RepID=A0A835KI54_9POAL|nr:hypothetical protein HU200_017973 [Digitaria exilis]
MAEKEKRRRSWFERIRRLFTSEPKEKPTPDKAKSKRWLPGKLRTQQSFALPAPAASDQQQIRQAEDEQSKHAMAVALATAAAAEAAVAAAHAAAGVVRLTGPQQPAPPPPGHEHIEREHEQAAVAIQSAYRGYLAVRRQTAATLRGLESLMRIQARHRSKSGAEEEEEDDDAMLLRRGRELYAAAVHVSRRDQNRSTARPGANVRMIGAAHARPHVVGVREPGGTGRVVTGGVDRGLVLEQQQQQAAGNKGWDSSIFSKEEMSAMTRSREEAALKRVRALQYASLQSEKLGIRRPPLSSRDEMDTTLNHQRWSWLDEWVGSQPPFDKDVPVAHQSPYTTAAAKDDPTAKTRRTPAAAVDPLAAGGDNDDRLGCSARRSFVRPRRAPARAAAAGDYYYYYDDVAAPCSPAPFPGYMASTASAKAKFRSMSTPKERGGGSDAYSEHCFPFADRMLSPIPSMSPIPSIASDMGFARSTARPPPIAQRSPRVAAKGPMTPARSRSRKSTNHHSFGSEAALHQLQMEHYTPVR